MWSPTASTRLTELCVTLISKRRKLRCWKNRKNISTRRNRTRREMTHTTTQPISPVSFLLVDMLSYGIIVAMVKGPGRFVVDW